MSAISENIKRLREQKRWSKREMSDRLNLKSYTTISKWESGENHPRGSDLINLCKLFNVSSDYLLGLVSEDKGDLINYYKYFPVSIPAGSLEVVDGIIEKDMKWLAMPDSVMNKYAGCSDIFFVNVVGTSMNKVIAPGSRVAIKKFDDCNLLSDGDIVVFSYDNQYSIKRFYNDVKYNRFIFRPDSTDDFHTDIVVQHSDADKIVIHGKVVINVSQYD